MSQISKGNEKAFSMALSIHSGFSLSHHIHFMPGFQSWLDIWETRTSDKGVSVTKCDLVAQLEGHDKGPNVTPLKLHY